MHRLIDFLNRWLVPFLTAVGDNPYMTAIRNGMVSVAPLTILGGLFTAVALLPVPGWEAWIGPYAQLLQIPVTATFGLLAIFVCFSVAYELAKQFGLEPPVSGSMATLVFLMIQIKREDLTLAMEGLGSQGLFTAIIVALICVAVQRAFNRANLVIRLPKDVPPVVYESFLSLTPLIFLVVAFWTIRFGVGLDINAGIQKAFSPLLIALNTLPGILVYAFLVTLLWSVGINGDNTLDAVVAAVFLQYLGANAEAALKGLPIPNITALGFFTTFVNVGGTGATIALALVMLNSRDPGYRKISRLSLPTQIFQINEPIFFGFPIVLNPVFMVPYVVSALTLTTCSYLLMDWGLIRRPVVSVPWTTPPIIGHFLATGGDWRAAVWGVVSIILAMGIYYPFARAAERRGRRDELRVES
ncbi:MAG: system lichenan-specific component [Verrucomicrobiota bacterium]|jgi:PTS system cellobiose-specific IIC component